MSNRHGQRQRQRQRSPREKDKKEGRDNREGREGRDAEKSKREEGDKKQRKEQRHSSRKQKSNKDDKNESIQKVEKKQKKQKKEKKEKKDKKDKSKRKDKSDRKQSKKRYQDYQQTRIKKRNKSKSGKKQKKASRQRSNRGEKKQAKRDKKRRQKRKYRFDSPPRSDDENLEDPEQMAKLTRMKAEQELVSTKADRKLYLGNLPPNITTNQLLELLNSALKKMNINTEEEGDSIVSAWISPDGVGHYAFVQFRTKQEASNGMALNNASLFGYQLKLGRPKQYLEYNKQLMNDMQNDGDLEGILKQIRAVGPEQEAKICEKILYPPSRILVLKHIINEEELRIDQEYSQIMEDINDMAQKFGRVRSITIPRPKNVESELQIAPKVSGVGLIFIEYDTVQMAKLARKQFLARMFSQKSITCGFFDQKQYKNKDFEINQEVDITF